LRSAIVFTAPRWSIATPFGSPVEPEVKMTYARSVQRVAAATATSELPAFEATTRSPSGHGVAGSPTATWACALRTIERSRSTGAIASTGT
jgi:hypothetical protein